MNARSVALAKRSSERVAGWRSEQHAQTKSANEERGRTVAVIRGATQAPAETLEGDFKKTFEKLQPTGAKSKTVF